MNLIKDFSMTPFTRTAWVSSMARSTWEAVIYNCSELVSSLEVESVAAGQRSCSWQTLKREALPEFTSSCARRGVYVLPVRWVGNFDGFIHYTPEGDSSVYCILSRRLEDALEFRDAFERGDHEKQGEKLGFPKCCREFFAREWKAGFFDPIWQSASSELYGSAGARRIAELDAAHPYSNPLLRYVGLRVGFHIPHSFSCPETIAAGIERLALAKDRDLVKLLEALLSMPMEATLLHGLLVVRTPIFYVIQYSVPTEDKYTIRVKGEFVPKEGLWREKAKN
jgi:hypothetical protein